MPGGEEDIEKTEKGREEEVMSESAERSFEINLKTLVSNEISHAKRVDVIAEQSLTDSVEFRKKADDAYLEQMQQMANAYMEQSKKQAEETLNFAAQWHHHAIENNRYTLDRLYSVFPEEAAGIATMVSLIVEALKQSGWTAPTTSG
jgi:hypothetical protein